MAARAARTATVEHDGRGEVELPDSVELYLNEIARFKLLTPQEEIDLFKRIEHGRVLNQLIDFHTAEMGTPPANEELTYLLLCEMELGLYLIRDSGAIRGFPPEGGIHEELRSEKLRAALDSAIDPRLERKLHLFSKQPVNRVHDAVISLSAGLRIFGPEAPVELEKALKLIERGATPR
jgi:hypothetical protein